MRINSVKAAAFELVPAFRADILRLIVDAYRVRPNRLCDRFELGHDYLATRSRLACRQHKQLSNGCKWGFPNFARVQREFVQKDKKHGVALRIRFDPGHSLARLRAFAVGTTLDLDALRTAQRIVAGRARVGQLKAKFVGGGIFGNLSGDAERLACQTVKLDGKRFDGCEYLAHSRFIGVAHLVSLAIVSLLTL
jgi:hypothetical protein